MNDTMLDDCDVAIDDERIDVLTASLAEHAVVAKKPKRKNSKRTHKEVLKPLAVVFEAPSNLFPNLESRAFYTQQNYDYGRWDDEYCAYNEDVSHVMFDTLNAILAAKETKPSTRFIACLPDMINKMHHVRSQYRPGNKIFTQNQKAKRADENNMFASKLVDYLSTHKRSLQRAQRLQSRQNKSYLTADLLTSLISPNSTDGVSEGIIGRFILNNADLWYYDAKHSKDFHLLEMGIQLNYQANKRMVDTYYEVDNLQVSMKDNMFNTREYYNDGTEILAKHTLLERDGLESSFYTYDPYSQNTITKSFGKNQRPGGPA